MKLERIFPDLKPPEPAKPIILDRSLLEHKANCPFQGDCILRGDPDEAGELGQIGTEGHKISEKILKDAFQNQRTDDLLTYADDTIQEIAQSRPDIQPQLIKAAKYLAEQIAHVPIERILTDNKGVPFVEYQIDFEICKNRDGTPVKITTCIDLCFTGAGNSLHVWDWKFGFRKYTNAMAEDAYQTCHICYILFQMFPTIDTIHFWYKNTRYGSSGYACIRRNEELPQMPGLTTEQQFLCRINSAVQLVLDNITEAWPEESKCAICPVIHKCPYKSKSLENIPVSQKELVDTIVVQTEWLKKLEKVATAIWKEKGELKGTKQVWDWQPTKKTPRLIGKEPKEEKEP